MLLKNGEKVIYKDKASRRFTNKHFKPGDLYVAYDLATFRKVCAALGKCKFNYVKRRTSDDTGWQIKILDDEVFKSKA